MRSFRLLILLLVGLVVLAAGLPVQADRLILSNGKTIEGTLVSRTEKEITFRIKNDAGITYTKKFPVGDVKKVERQQGPASGSSGSKASSKFKKPAHKDTDPDALFGEVLDAWNRKDYKSGGVAVSKLIAALEPQAVQDYDEKAEKAVKKNLAELAASMHLAEAIDRSRGGPVSLKHVTKHELEAIGELLEQVIDEAIEYENEPDPEKQGPNKQGGFVAVLMARLREVEKLIDAEPEPDKPETDSQEDPTADPDGGQNAPAEQTVLYWLDDPENYDGDDLQMNVFVRHLLFTLSLMRERIKYDPRVKKNAALKKDVLGIQKKAQRLLSSARDRRKGKPTKNERAAALQERNERSRAELRHRRDEEKRRQAKEARDHRAREERDRLDINRLRSPSGGS